MEMKDCGVIFAGGISMNIPLATLLILACVGYQPAPSTQAHGPGTQTGQPDSLKQGMTNHTMVGRIYKPKIAPATSERVAKLRVPEGFSVRKVAEGLENIRALRMSPDGRHLYATRRTQMDVILLTDGDNDGVYESYRPVARRPPMLHDLAFRDGKVYLISISEVLEATVNPDGSFGELSPVISGLPDAGQHPNRTLAFGPDGLLYISIGSATNSADETNPEAATLVVADPNNNWKREIFAEGLRNTIGFDWHPETGELFGADNGIDWLGDDVNTEEFNLIRRGKHYGWPFIYDDGKFNPKSEPKETTYAEFAARTEKPLLGWTPHAAPMQMAFNRGEMFPADHRHDAFVVMRGSWNRYPPSGFEVVRVDFEQGRPRSITPFLTGFITHTPDGYETFARPFGLVFLPDGSMLVGDDANGVIYRVTYEAGR